MITAKNPEVETSWQVGSAVALAQTPFDLVGCNYRLLQRKRHPEIPLTAAKQQRLDRINLYLTATKARIPAGYPAGDEYTTLEAMAAGEPLIEDAVFCSAATFGLTVEVPYLTKVPGGYVPIIISTHRVVTPSKKQAGFIIPLSRLGGGTPLPTTFKPKPHPEDNLRVILADLALAEVDQSVGMGGMIGQDDTVAYLQHTQRLRRGLEVALAREEQDAPRRVRECGSCQFWELCETELKAADDISLFAAGDKGEALRNQGFSTVQALIEHGPKEQAELAGAWRKGQPVLVKSLESTPQHDVEIEIDMEAYLDAGAYLWGLLDGDEYLPFATWQLQEEEPLEVLGTEIEGQNFARFWHVLSEKIAAASKAGKTVAVHCYSKTGENHFLTLSAARFGGTVYQDEEYGEITAPTMDIIHKFISGPNWIDVYDLVKRQLVGTFGLSLKTVGNQAGFFWRDVETAGEASMELYRSGTAADRQQLLRYNEDDCRATKQVRQWLRAGAPGAPRLSSAQ